MTPLERQIRELIENEGPIPVSRYMRICLSHPQHGYYTTRDPLGASGDFITAPEISQMFGELIGLWAAQVWASMGSPPSIQIVELGPGRGTLMSDFLRAASVVPEFRAAISVHLVETSPTLRAIQEAALRETGATATWHMAADSLPENPLIAVANEFIDALPIDQLVRDEDGWHERRIGLRDGRLAFGLDPSPLSFPDGEATAHARAPLGATVERRDLTAVSGVLRRLATHGGAALIVDYGHERSAPGDTLQAVRSHAFTDPLEQPGTADLTAHVDFEALARCARAAGLTAHGPLTQSEFLQRLGIELRAENLKRGQPAGSRAEIDAALARLTGPAPGMGELFKAIALTPPDTPAPPAFDN